MADNFSRAMYKNETPRENETKRLKQYIKLYHVYLLNICTIITT